MCMCMYIMYMHIYIHICISKRVRSPVSKAALVYELPEDGQQLKAKHVGAVIN